MKMRFKWIIPWSIFIAVFASCNRNVDERPVLAVSIEPQRNILRHIAGDRFNITALMPNGDNPETFEPSPIKRLDAENSLLYFSLGLLPFEKSLFDSSSQKNKFINTTDGIEILYGTHSHSHGEGNSHHTHIHTVPDPHVWTSIKNIRTMASNMADALVKLDPNNQDEYKSNLKKYTEYLDSIDLSYKEKFKHSKNKAFLVWHPSLSYFAKDYGLEQVSVSSDTKEMSVSSVSNVIEKAKSDSIKIMFFQREFDNRQAETICKSIGARLVPINPNSFDWEKELTEIVDELSK